MRTDPFELIKPEIVQTAGFSLSTTCIIALLGAELYRGDTSEIAAAPEEKAANVDDATGRNVPQQQVSIVTR